MCLACLACSRETGYSIKHIWDVIKFIVFRHRSIYMQSHVKKTQTLVNKEIIYNRFMYVHSDLLSIQRVSMRLESKGNE